MDCRKIIQDTKRPPYGDLFWLRESQASLDADDVDRCRALFAILYFEGDFVALAEFVELDVDQGPAVEEQVFFLAVSTDEAEAAIGELLDNTVHRFI